jgi:hypothetical protein
MKRLSLEDQLKVLKQAKAEYSYGILRGICCGLCTCISHSLMCCLNIIYQRKGYADLRFFIPLFTRKNAVLYYQGRSKGDYWWDREDSNRGAFLDWMIQELQMEIYCKQGAFT